MRTAGASRTFRAGLIGALVLPTVLAGCGLKSGSPMADDVVPGSVGQGRPLQGASLTVTSKNFSENIILGQMIGLVFKAAGAEVLDRTNLPGSISAREAIIKGDADAMYEYTGTAWITYLGHAKPITDPLKQWEAVRDEDRKNGVTWLPQSTLNNTYALAISKKNNAKYHLRTLSDVAALARRKPSAVTICVENEFASRDDGLPGMEKAYGMSIPPGNIKKMDAGIIYTQVSKSNSCLLGEVYTTDGRIKAMDLDVLVDDKHFFPNYNAAPVIHTATFDRYPEIAGLLDPVSRRLTTEVAQELNAKVDVDGQDPHIVAKDWLIQEGFIKDSP
ncbi:MULTISPECIES: glycine betaine ABC transporter substrate-binding protein [Streptomyces]|jgi:osmoprotectant transport system substrate-binding protein|uniref:glycine betaine ABC transporter substrate-binding protein n=2 Tax=unclassified Streptomyces TaxID=2593676 RepID=UPI00088D8110|nr:MULTISPECIES: glycine betaine ABC transporter substrate-binding protein [unclassified Streptomyces]MDX2728451.1 glycine betaine ABC transporter substrate-binding protein [Streptomyces sp. PA03-2a]MDX3769229.1 glycine betaine ABC transporter substrate-binding protein [Streptomyces sp. AK08-01B]MDX3818293.1 glycine betaine ABC transporter substrate-binding protein [Streptomyces sp. AK08-01A]SCZ06719.1 osmoprotectant transport system substrate-binding protein [Streptomyces sp. 136MFCol5.1]